MKYELAQRIVGRSRFLRRLTLGLFARFELLVMRGHKDREVLRSIRRSRRVAESLLSANEAFLLHSLVQAQSRLGGAMAELGVYQGSSAQIICEVKQACPLYLFDTFTGLPDPGQDETRALTHGQYAASLFSVRKLLHAYTNVYFRVGIFPQSAMRIGDVRFSFVHLDGDLYSSTLAGLEFFYPRMIPGGIILTHDYSTLPGVARAFTDFLRDRPEAVIELPTTQAMIIVQDPPIRREETTAARES
jgi:O-methyltransferase